MTSPKPTPAAQFAHLATQVHDHSTVLQALQIDMRHAVKLLDKLVVVADKQTELGHELSRHSDSFERVFKEMGGVESKLGKAIDGLTAALREDREKSEKVAETVTGYRGGLKTLMLIGGTVTGLLLVIGGMFATSVSRDQARAQAGVAELRSDFERRRLAIDLKIETLTQQVIEVKMDRRRDREAKEENR